MLCGRDSKTGGTPDKEAADMLSVCECGRKTRDERKRGEQQRPPEIQSDKCHRWQRRGGSQSVTIGREALMSAGGSPYKVLLHTALTAAPVAMETAS